jgi:accessory colonization factor AcfC
MYDNIYKHADCPSEDIICDDDALDGWMILEKRKSQNKDKETVIDHLIKNEKIKNSSEIFIMSDGSKEHREFVNNLNDPQALKIKKEKFDHLAKVGEAEEQTMPDAKRKMREIYYG